MRKTIWVLFSVSLGLIACDQSDPAKEVQNYCECIQSAVGEAAMESCRKQRNELIKKYEFDPEASEIIADELKKCGEQN